MLEYEKEVVKPALELFGFLRGLPGASVCVQCCDGVLLEEELIAGHLSEEGHGVPTLCWNARMYRLNQAKGKRGLKKRVSDWPAQYQRMVSPAMTQMVM